MMAKQQEQIQFLKSQSQRLAKSETIEMMSPHGWLYSQLYNKKWLILTLMIAFFYSSLCYLENKDLKKEIKVLSQPKIIGQKIKALKGIKRQSLIKKEHLINLAEEKNTYQAHLPEEFKFQVPKYVWLTRNDHQKSSYIIQRARQNIKYYTEASGFELKIASINNYSELFPSEQRKILQSYFKQIEVANSSYSLKVKLRQTILKLSLIIYYGGIVMKDSYILTEKLNWLQSIKNNLHVNTGNPYTIPKCFAFLSILDGPPPQQQNIKVQYQSDKKIIKIPAIKDIFWAAIPNSDFFKSLLQYYLHVIRRLSQITSLIIQAGLQENQLNLDDHQTLIYLSSVLMLQAKQRQLDGRGQKYLGTYRKLAIDELGLLTLNANYFPDKMHFYFDNRLRYYDSYFNYIAKLPQQQFQDSIGPMRYLAGIDPFGQFNSRLLAAIANSGKYEIWIGSFLQNYLFWEGNQTFLRTKPKYQAKTVEGISCKWNNLLKNLWLYWDSGFENAPVVTQLCVLNLKKMAHEAGYNVQEVNRNNIDEYISADLIRKINETIKNAKMPILEQTKSDLIRLALVLTYGGIYLDSSFFFLEDFNWITNIAREPNKYIFNRFGNVPQVLMQFHPIQGGLFDWKMDEKQETKLQWHLAEENNFIAAEANNQLINEWLEMMIYFTTNNFDITYQKMVQCGVDKLKWTSQFDRYLTAMDSLKTVIGCRQRDIEKNVAKYPQIKNVNDYYKLWVFNGFTGIQKFRNYNNYANPIRKQLFIQYNYLLFERSEQYVKQVYGPIYKAIKLYGIRNSILKDFVARNWKTKFIQEAHPESIFMRYLYHSDYQYFQTEELHVRLKQ